MRRPVGQRSRGSATAGPGAKAGDRAGTRAQCTTSPTASLTDAHVLVDATFWLVSLSDWLTEELDLADGEAVRLRLSDVERMRDSLIRCLACLDTLGIDPAQLTPFDGASTESAPSTATPSPRTLQ